MKSEGLNIEVPSKIPSNTVHQLQKGINPNFDHVHCLYTYITKGEKLILCQIFLGTAGRFKCPLGCSSDSLLWFLARFSLICTSCSWLLKGNNNEMFQSHTADIPVPPPLCFRTPSSIQAFSGIFALLAALLPLCPRLTSPVSLIVKVPIELMLKPAFFWGFPTAKHPWSGLCHCCWMCGRGKMCWFILLC